MKSTKLGLRWLGVAACLGALGCGGNKSSHVQPAVDAAVAHDAGGGGAAAGSGGGTADSSVVLPDAGVPAGADCTTEQGFCIAANGVQNAKPFTCHTTTRFVGDVVRLLVGTPSWGVSCDDAEGVRTLTLTFPVQAAGPINLAVSPADVGSGLKFSVSASTLSAGATLGSMTESSSNLLAGRLVGSVSSQNNQTMATGTLTASWGPTTTTCTSGDLGNPCAEGTLAMTFHVPLP